MSLRYWFCGPVGSAEPCVGVDRETVGRIQCNVTGQRIGKMNRVGGWPVAHAALAARSRTERIGPDANVDRRGPAKAASLSVTWTKVRLVTAAQVLNARCTAASKDPAPNSVSMLVRRDGKVLVPVRISRVVLVADWHADATPTGASIKLQVTLAPVPWTLLPHLSQTPLPQITLYA